MQPNPIQQVRSLLLDMYGREFCSTKTWVEHSVEHFYFLSHDTPLTVIVKPVLRGAFNHIKSTFIIRYWNISINGIQHELRLILLARARLHVLIIATFKGFVKPCQRFHIFYHISQISYRTLSPWILKFVQSIQDDYNVMG